MTDYRVFQRDQHGHLIAPPYVIRCEDDKEAVAQAAFLVAENAVEIWAGERLVKMIPAD